LQTTDTQSIANRDYLFHRQIIFAQSDGESSKLCVFSLVLLLRMANISDKFWFIFFKCSKIKFQTP
jgi:hypothetical protein